MQLIIKQATNPMVWRRFLSILSMFCFGTCHAECVHQKLRKLNVLEMGRETLHAPLAQLLACFMGHASAGTVLNMENGVATFVILKHIIR